MARKANLKSTKGWASLPSKSCRFISFHSDRTSAISNCLFSTTLEIPAEFSACSVLAKVRPNQRNCS